ncbi:protein of unknown function [Cupriavidus taiwanensis]|nr:protein of unknown function [Cupriavidus taiwanensis]
MCIDSTEYTRKNQMRGLVLKAGGRLEFLTWSDANEAGGRRICRLRCDGRRRRISYGCGSV